MSQKIPDLQGRTLLISETQSLDEIQNRVLLCNETPAAEILRLAVDKKASQIVQEGCKYHEIELRSSIAMMDNPDSFFRFPLSVVLRPDSICAETEASLSALNLTFSRSDQKARILEQVEGYIESLGQPRSLLDDVRLVADELFMNAMYNAPFVSQNLSVDRAKEVVLPQDPAGRIQLGTHDSRLVLLCEDVFGTLNIQNLLARVKRCYDEGTKSVMNFGEGGAGIGSYMVFNSCMSMYFGVRKQQSTLIACVFPIGRANRLKESLFKSIHYLDL